MEIFTKVEFVLFILVLLKVFVILMIIDNTDAKVVALDIDLSQDLLQPLRQVSECVFKGAGDPPNAKNRLYRWRGDAPAVPSIFSIASLPVKFSTITSNLRSGESTLLSDFGPPSKWQSDLLARQALPTSGSGAHTVVRMQHRPTRLLALVSQIIEAQSFDNTTLGKKPVTERKVVHKTEMPPEAGNFGKIGQNRVKNGILEGLLGGVEQAE